jgi:hypothetical protein
VPGPTPVTIPVEPTVATPLLLLLHVPPAAAPVNVVVPPLAHKVSVPVIVGVPVIVTVTGIVVDPEIGQPLSWKVT